MSTPISLDSAPVAFSIDGHAFETDAFDACDLLQPIDAKSTPGQPLAPELLDEIAALVRTQYGVPRCGRRAAGQFYVAVTSAAADAKKKSSPPPESPTGTGWMPLDGPSDESASGASCSSSSTPSAI